MVAGGRYTTSIMKPSDHWLNTCTFRIGLSQYWCPGARGQRSGHSFFEIRTFVFDMATRTGTGVDQPTAEPPDAPYAVVAGLYIAALLAPVVVLGLSTFVTDAGLLYISLLATGTVLTVVSGWGVSRTAGLAVDLGRHTATRLLAAFPFAWFGGVVGMTAIRGDPPGIAVLLAMLGTIGGMFLGLILTGMSRNRHAAAVLTDAEEIAQWEARWPRRWRRIAVGGAIVTGVAGLAGLVAQFAFDVDWTGSFHAVWVVWAPAAGAANPRTFRVTDAGLVVERPLQRRFRPWAAISGYTLTDDALVVQQSAWWRLSYRCDRADIENVDTVVTALETSEGDGVMSICADEP